MPGGHCVGDFEQPPLDCPLPFGLRHRHKFVACHDLSGNGKAGTQAFRGLAAFFAVQRHTAHGKASSNLISPAGNAPRSEEHTSELKSLMRISYAVFCLKQQTKTINTTQ